MGTSATSTKTSVAVGADKGLLRLRVRLHGKQRTIYLGLSDTEAHRRIASELATWLKAELDEHRYQALDAVKERIPVTLDQLRAKLSAAIASKPSHQPEKALLRMLDGYTGSVEGILPNVVMDGQRTASTINRYLMVLRKLAPHAYGDVQKFRAGGAVKPRALTPEQVPLVLDHLEHNYPPMYYLFVLLLLRTGMRTSEVLALKWQDVDLENSWICVHAGLVRNASSTKLERRPTKTGKARLVPIDHSLLVVLNNVYKVEVEKGLMRDELLVVRDPGTTGNTPLHVDRFRRVCWIETLRELGVPYVKLYACRATFISAALASGMPPAELAVVTGHSLRVMLSHYATKVATPTAVRLPY